MWQQYAPAQPTCVGEEGSGTVTLENVCVTLAVFRSRDSVRTRRELVCGVLSLAADSGLLVASVHFLSESATTK